MSIFKSGFRYRYKNVQSLNTNWNEIINKKVDMENHIWKQNIHSLVATRTWWKTKKEVKHMTDNARLFVFTSRVFCDTFLIIDLMSHNWLLSAFIQWCTFFKCNIARERFYLWCVSFEFMVWSIYSANN